MKQNLKVQTMVIAALLCAIGIMIPMFAPKIVLGPASFTLASHVPVFIAMFISPAVALSVAVVTGFGFFFAGFPLIIVLRALTHVVFALVGAALLKRHEALLKAPQNALLFGLLLAVIHAVCEVSVVTSFYLSGNVTGGYLYTVVLLVGVGTVVHSMVDFGIAVFVWKHIVNAVSIPVCAKV